MIFKKKSHDQVIKKYITGYPIITSCGTYHPVYHLICDGFESSVFGHMEPKGYLVVQEDHMTFLSLDEQLDINKLGINKQDLMDLNKEAL